MPTKLVVPESEQEPNESRRCASIIAVANTLPGFGKADDLVFLQVMEQADRCDSEE